MEVRFENIGVNCEKCGKPAQWEYYANALLESYVADRSEARYYCDRCHAKKYEDKDET